MTDKEDLLTEIERIRSEIDILHAEIESEKIYGEHWRVYDYRSRRSHASGDLCLLIIRIDRADAKAHRRPRSIGARKARQKAKAYRRQLRQLVPVIAEKVSDYHPVKPQYLSGDLHFVWSFPEYKVKILSMTLDRSMPYLAT